jgi:hypothetical protein
MKEQETARLKARENKLHSQPRLRLFDRGTLKSAVYKQLQKIFWTVKGQNQIAFKTAAQ